MNANLNFASASSTMTVAAAALAATIATGILSAIVNLFQIRGAPMQRLVAAERACAPHAYQSARETCMKQWLADSQGTSVASR